MAVARVDVLVESILRGDNTVTDPDATLWQRRVLGQLVMLNKQITEVREVLEALVKEK